MINSTYLKNSYFRYYAQFRQGRNVVLQKGIFALLFFTLSLTTLLAQKTWTGSGGTDWNTSGNWSPSGVPITTDDVIIPAVTNKPVIGAGVTATAKSVQVQSGSSLSVASTGSLSVVGNTNTLTPSFSYAFYNLGTVNNSGLLVISNEINKWFGVVNEGTFTNNTGSELRIDNATSIHFWNRIVTTTPVLTNSGKISIGQSSTTSSSSGIFNETTVLNNTGAEIMVDQISSAHIFNLPNSSLTNSGTISIGQTQTTISGTGIYNFGASQNLTGGTIKVDRTYSGIHTGTQVYLYSLPGTVTAPSSFTNAGKILVGQTASISGPGIFNISSGTAVVSFINTAGAEIVIDRTSSGGIHNENSSSLPTSFINAGKISVGQSSTVGGPGLYTFSSNAPVTFLNATGAEIIIDRTGYVGIHTQNLNSAPTSFTNAGKITIGQSASIGGPGIANYSSSGLLTFLNAPGAEIMIDRTLAGIQNGQYNSTTAVLFNNAGPIKIGTMAGQATDSYGDMRPGITNFSPFINQATGSITIERVNHTGLFHQANTFTNNGTITIGASTTVGNTYNTRPGLFNSGTFVNGSGAVLQIDHSPWSGLHNYTDAVLTNSGLIDIGKNVLGGEIGFFTAGTVTNGLSGTINVDHVTGNGYSVNGMFVNNTFFTNTGKITIGNSSSAGNNGLYNNSGSTFTNSGEITIDHSTVSPGNTGYHGLRNDNIFTNTGKINIGNNASAGNWGLWNARTFTNNSGGAVTINRSAVTGLRSEGGSSTTFTNGGSINIGNTVSIGNWGLWNGATFINSGNGVITVDRSTEADFVNGSIASSGIFTNAASASLSLGTISATAENGLYNYSTSTFSNSACATLTLYNSLSNLGAFTNQGVFVVNTAKPHNNNTTLTNDGVIDYYQNNLIPSVTNNDLIIVPISSSCSLATTPVLLVGGSNSFSVATTWYKDPGLTQPAGTFDLASNTFTPTDLSPGANTLWFSVADNNCTKTVAIQVQFDGSTGGGTTSSASIQSLTVVGTLGSPNCSVTLTGQATGSSFVFTGPNGYVFSNVYRSAGTHSIVAPQIMQPGVYTLTANALNGCGISIPISQTLIVNGTQCP